MQPYRWLAAEWDDLRRAPAASIGYGVLFVGLVIGFPLVGHATWHAHRDLVKQ